MESYLTRVIESLGLDAVRTLMMSFNRDTRRMLQPLAGGWPGLLLFVLVRHRQALAASA